MTHLFYNRVHFPAQWEREIIKDILGIEISIKDLIISVMLKQAAQTTANDYKINSFLTTYYYFLHATFLIAQQIPHVILP